MCITKSLHPSTASRALLSTDRPAIQARWPVAVQRCRGVAVTRPTALPTNKTETQQHDSPTPRILAPSQINHIAAAAGSDAKPLANTPSLLCSNHDFAEGMHGHSPRNQALPMPRPFRASHVVASASISPALPSSSMDVTRRAAATSQAAALPPIPHPADTILQSMQQVAAQQQALWQQATSAAAAEVSKLAGSIPVAGATLASVASDVAAAALRSSASVTQSVRGQMQDDVSRLQQAWVALQARGDTLMELQAKVAALDAERQSLQGQLDEARNRAQFVESLNSTMQAQMDEKKALSALDDAAQEFRRHLCGVPSDVKPSQFQEHPDDMIGKGGCATVFKWRVGQTDWAVKSDPISYRHVTQRFDPQRCGDLLPAFLPPHPNIMAPKAWWVRSLAQTQTSFTNTNTAAPMNTSTKPASGFKLYTLYEKYSCSLWDFMQALHTAQQHKTTTTTTTTKASTKSATTAATASNGGAFSAASASQPLLLDLRSLLVVIRDVAAALEHLSVHRVVHGDVKAENVLLVLQTPKSDGSDQQAGKPQRVARAVLIDFGLCCMLPQGMDKMAARGGTWMYKAPEQMTGPPGIMLGGQMMSADPHVELQTDVWSLGLLICMLCNNGALPSKPGLPFGIPEEQLLKWGDRPKGGSQEPFWMSWDDVLPKVPGTTGARQARLDDDYDTDDECEIKGCAARAEVRERQHAHVMALLRRLAQGCLQRDPRQRPTAGQVRAAVGEALAQLV